MGKWGRRRRKNEGDDRIKLCVSQIRKEKEEILKPIDYIILYYVSSGCFHTYSLTSQIPSTVIIGNKTSFIFYIK
jgi:hypothetical protein